MPIRMKVMTAPKAGMSTALSIMTMPMAREFSKK